MVRLITDSGADLSVDYLQAHNVEFIPFTLTIDGETYTDQHDITTDGVLQAIKDKRNVKTQQASPEQLLNAFTKVAKTGEDAIYICFSSELSGTYQTAKLIYDDVLNNYPDFNLTIVDTHAASMGQGLIVNRAIDHNNHYNHLDDILSAIQRDIENIIHYFTVDDLHHLAQGGRLSKGSAFLGSVMNIKPLLHVENGKLVPFEKLRGTKKLIKSMVNHFDKQAQSSVKKHIAICHADAIESAETLKQELLNIRPDAEIDIYNIGPIIGCHTGMGCFTLFFFKELDDE